MDSSSLIIISGLPGSGKSFFAEKLASAIDACYFSSDQIRSALSLRGKYSPSEKKAVYEHMLELTRNCLRDKIPVVVDATFHKAEMRDLFLDFAAEESLNVFCFEVWADESLIKLRLSNPREDSEADYRIYSKLKQEYEAWTTPRLRLESTQTNIGSMLDIAMEYLEDENV